MSALRTYTNISSNFMQTLDWVEISANLRVSGRSILLIILHMAWFAAILSANISPIEQELTSYRANAYRKIG